MKSNEGAENLGKLLFKSIERKDLPPDVLETVAEYEQTTATSQEKGLEISAYTKRVIKDENKQVDKIIFRMEGWIAQKDRRDNLRKGKSPVTIEITKDKDGNIIGKNVNW